MAQQVVNPDILGQLAASRTLANVTVIRHLLD
jgi:hypothetical protein